MENELAFRNAERKDTALILQFIKKLAEYEKMSDEVIAGISQLSSDVLEYTLKIYT